MPVCTRQCLAQINCKVSSPSCECNMMTSPPLPQALIVEDEAMASLKLARDLENLGYITHIARNKAELGELLDSGLQPAVAFIDLDLGQDTGLEASALIKRTLPDCPFVFATAHGRFVLQDYAHQETTAPLLQKPYSTNDLRSQLERLRLPVGNKTPHGPVPQLDTPVENEADASQPRVWPEG